MRLASFTHPSPGQLADRFIYIFVCVCVSVRVFVFHRHSVILPGFSSQSKKCADSLTLCHRLPEQSRSESFITRVQIWASLPEVTSGSQQNESSG